MSAFSAQAEPEAGGWTVFRNCEEQKVYRSNFEKSAQAV